MSRFNNVLRTQCGKLQVSDKQNRIIEQRVAYFLGNMARQISSGSLQDRNVENYDETHFVMSMDNSKCLDFCGDTKLRYADVTSGGEGMTIVVPISGGSEEKVENPFILFQNKQRNYPFRGVPDDVSGLRYRTGQKGWIDGSVMQHIFSEPHAIRELHNGRNWVLFMDNWSAHNLSDELRNIIEKTNTEIHFLPPNSTHLLQPCDSFFIQNIKVTWTSLWEKYKATYTEHLGSPENYGTKSGFLPNPEKSFFYNLLQRQSGMSTIKG